ncbi:MAG: alternative ribosome rescue aminoacyl-tRNA hydrolase ArfB [Gemmatimonadota bacterium]
MSERSVPIPGGPSIPLSELTYQASRSGGPGGQHVNTSSTRVELTWNVTASPSLTDAQRARILEKLAGRISGEGELRLASDSHRSQTRNKDDVTQRFQELVAEALQVPKPRRKTRPTRAAKEKRLQEKRRRSETKRRRGPVDAGD